MDGYLLLTHCFPPLPSPPLTEACVHRRLPPHLSKQTCIPSSPGKVWAVAALLPYMAVAFAVPRILLRSSNSLKRTLAKFTNMSRYTLVCVKCVCLCTLCMCGMCVYILVIYLPRTSVMIFKCRMVIGMHMCAYVCICVMCMCVGGAYVHTSCVLCVYHLLQP